MSAAGFLGGGQAAQHAGLAGGIPMAGMHPLPGGLMQGDMAAQSAGQDNMIIPDDDLDEYEDNFGAYGAMPHDDGAVKELKEDFFNGARARLGLFRRIRPTSFARRLRPGANTIAIRSHVRLACCFRFRR